jgi:hypothetical protein
VCMGVCGRPGLLSRSSTCWTELGCWKNGLLRWMLRRLRSWELPCQACTVASICRLQTPPFLLLFSFLSPWSVSAVSSHPSGSRSLPPLCLYPLSTRLARARSRSKPGPAHRTHDSQRFPRHTSSSHAGPGSEQAVNKWSKRAKRTETLAHVRPGVRA